VKLAGAKAGGRTREPLPATGVTRRSTRRRSTWLLAACTLAAIAAATPGALRDAHDTGAPYLFSWAFLADLPRRLTGPGRLRFLFQPATALLLGARAGVADARAGRPPYLVAMLAHPEHRRQIAAESLQQLANLLLIGVLADVICQWLMLGVAHPVAAMVVGPVLIGLPYGLARGIGNRVAMLRRRP
jgi:hypothetical protein